MVDILVPFIYLMLIQPVQRSVKHHGFLLSLSHVTGR